MPEILVDGRPAFWGTAGTEWRDGAPTLVFVHGAGNDHSVWALQARSLAQDGWNVMVPDLPGHGRSADRGDVASIAGYAAWLERLLEAIGSESHALVGHSMGACIVVEYASTRGGVEALAAVGAGAAMPVSKVLLEATLQRPLEAHQFITAFGHGRGSHFGGAQTPGVWMLGAAMALLDRCSPAVLHRDFAACNDWRAHDTDSIDAPTLIVSGGSDRMTPPKAGRALAETIPDARFELIESAGHMMMAEAPTELTAQLQSLLGPIAARST